MAASIIAVTPAHNEERFLPNLIRCMTNQSLRPRSWTIIDDGSSDQTARIIDQAAAAYAWIKAVHLPLHTLRAPGGESVIMPELRPERLGAADFIFRVDADVTFDNHFLEHLINKFERTPKLGIASGMLYEPAANNSWRPLREPSFQPTGPCRVYSRRCFDTLGRLESTLGWDTVDVTTALMRGFDTRNFRDLTVYHHRPMQTASGPRQGRLNAGVAAYNAGYSFLFMIVRSCRHACTPPWVVGGALMLFAYLRCWLTGMPRLADPELMAFVRRQQLRRLCGLTTIWK
ncbi:MAG TPA: glycosyltransferase family A protein [Candidatus Binataceae bacterium]|nr:glycosyltransferase family A protein [Candidatus Binataceae bacterium]